ncbi:MAG: hypothetical protein GXY44_09245 [Phycisphaerales bacterium]|nr:hypothetical protein [Phycisphaerales bacterium]
MIQSKWLWLVLVAILLSGCTTTGQSLASSQSLVQINYTYTFDCPAGPISFPIQQSLDSQAHYRLRTRDGQVIPAQLDERGRIWIWQHGGKEGQVNQYQLEIVDSGEITEGVQVRPVSENTIDVRINGELFTVFHLARKEGDFKPYLYPVIGPTGEPVTRDYPMQDNPIESENKRLDHSHHRSFFSAHGDVRTQDLEQEGTNYWHEGHGPKQGRQVVRRIVRTVSGPVFGLVEAEIDWMGPGDKREIAETRTYTFYRGDNDTRIIDAQNIFNFQDGDVMFADTKEAGIITLRLAVHMDEVGIDTPQQLRGRMTNSRGGVGPQQCWGKQAEWCDYYGQMFSGVTVGVAIMDAPSNPRHPTYWHIRNYGLYPANPFGARDFTGDKNQDGSMLCKQGERVEFNYRVLIHKGDTREARVEDCYRLYRIPQGTVAE